MRNGMKRQIDIVTSLGILAAAIGSLDRFALLHAQPHRLMPHHDRDDTKRHEQWCDRKKNDLMFEFHSGNLSPRAPTRHRSLSFLFFSPTPSCLPVYLRVPT